MDPNKDNPEAVASPPDPSNPPQDPPSNPEPSPPPPDDALAALDKGIDEAADAPVGDEPEPETEPTPEAEPKPEAGDEPVGDVEAEMATLGIKPESKSGNRFREMAGEIKTLHAALEAAGVKDVAELPSLAERAKYGEEMVTMVMDTGADAAQFGQALDYLKLVNAAGQGDREAAEKAFEVMSRELQVLGQVLGREVPGIVDPLAEHADLLDEVEMGDLTRARALEIAAQRNNDKIIEANRTRQQERDGQSRQQQEAVEAARADLGAWDQQMLANDPTYAGKRAALNEAVAQIRATRPPSEWLRETALAYAKIPTPAAAPAPKPTPGPIRGNRGSQGMVPDVSKLSMAQAFDIGAGL